jgi:predicted DsbA family dithiol-disulfide isomerase
MDDPENLIDAVRRAGLDVDRAREILATDEFEAETRASEQKYLGLGISSVPSLILNDKYLLQGAQPVESFEQALRQLASAT